MYGIFFPNLSSIISLKTALAKICSVFPHSHKPRKNTFIFIGTFLKKPEFLNHTEVRRTYVQEQKKTPSLTSPIGYSILVYVSPTQHSFFDDLNCGGFFNCCVFGFVHFHSYRALKF